jgi:predicted DNA-binding WGR domain protein
MELRSLRYSDGTSDKFWEIQRSGASHRVRYGRYGTAGQSQTKVFDGDDAARKSFEKLVAEKLKKGYVEDGGAIASPEPDIKPQTTTTKSIPVAIPENWRSLALREIQEQLVQDQKQLCELAAIDAIPEEYWGLLNVEVRKAIASQPFNPPQVYQKLAEDEHDVVREAIAANLYTPTDLLLKLSNDSVVEVRLAIAKNQVSPRMVIDLLTKDSYQKIRKAALANQQEYDLTLRLIQNRQDKQNDTNKVIHPIDDLTLLEENQLLDLSSWDHSLRWYIKSHSTAHQSSERLAQMVQEINCDQRLKDSEYRLLVSIAYNLNTPVPILEKLINLNQTQGDALHGGPCYILRNPILEAIALNPSTPYELLVKLAEQNDLFIAIALAFNKKTPKKILEIIGNSKDLVISTGNMYGVYSGQLEKERKQIFELFYLALSHNPNTPQDILEHMISGKIKVTGSHYTPVSILKYGNQFVSGRLTPAQIALHHRQQSCDRSYQDINLKIGNKTSTLGRYIKHLITHQSNIAHSSSWFDRYAIAQNSNTPKDLLETLAQDEHPYVQAAARSALGLEVICSSDIKAVEAIAPEPPQTIPANREKDIAPVELKIERSLNLAPEDYRWVVWLDRESIAKTKDYPCDRVQALNNLVVKLRINKNQDLSGMTLEDILPNILREAHQQQITDLVPDIIASLYVAFGFQNLFLTFVSISQWSETKCVELMRDALKDNQYYSHSIKLAFDPDFLINQPYSRRELHRKLIQWSHTFFQWLSCSFEKDVLSCLDNIEREQLRQELQLFLPNLVNEEQWQSIFHVATSLGLKDEVEACVVKIEPRSLGKRYFIHDGSHGSFYLTKQTPSLVLRLHSLSLMKEQMKRLDYVPNSPNEIRACLAALGVDALEFICQCIKRSGSSTILDIFLKIVNMPEIAPYLLELSLQSKVSKEAQLWLDTFTDNTILGLLPTAAGIDVQPVFLGKNELIEAARKHLRSQAQRGKRSLVEQACELVGEDVANIIQREIFEHPDLNLQTLSPSNTPEWLTTGMIELPSGKSAKHKTWIEPEDLPPISIDCDRLSREQIIACLTALSLSTLNSPLPLIRNLKIHISPVCLDNFSWALFQRWLTEGAPSKEKWAMLSLGLLGSDHIALKLTPLIRAWPGESQHNRAVLGLECLRAIGTDTALMQIHGIAQKIKFQGLKGRAQDCMEAIARDRQLSRDQLADRIIPDCGLDSNGNRTFDFGPRQFQFLLGLDLKPMLRDPAGKKITALPKPTSKDDPEKAATAIADWKLIKKQISEIVKLHSVRMESAMVEHRTWTGSEFETLLVRHPLMTHLVQRIIWATYNHHGQLQATFRVAEDRSYSDCNDVPCSLDPEAMIGIPHRLSLDETTQSLWGEVLGDYEIIQPFPQLNRETYELLEAEQDELELKRFSQTKIPGATLARMMENQGWLKGGLHDHGDYSVH